MKYAKTTPTALAIATSAAITLIMPAARAFTITQNNNASILFNSLLGNTSGLSNFQVSTIGDPEAFGTFENDPFGLGSGIVLSTGRVQEIAGQNKQDGSGGSFNNDLSTDFGSQEESGDSISLNVSFDASSSVDKLLFQYVFGSEEFTEFVGTNFNDSFQLLLNGVNLAQLSDGKPVTINNLVPSANGLFHADYINNPAGPNTTTKLDGYTKVLTFEGLLKQNARNTLTINIQDVGDGLLDSAIFFKSGSFSTLSALSVSEKIPEPPVIFGLLSLSAMASLHGRKKPTFHSS